MTLTMTINDHLVELGTLVDNQAPSVQRVGARLVDEFFASNAAKQSDEVIVNVLYYLTDIQVRDYALGLLDAGLSGYLEPALQVLMDKAPTDTIYMDAPACMLAVLQYEQGNSGEARVTLSNASPNYSLALLLQRVFAANAPREMFSKMRKELHPQVVEGIFRGENND